MNGYSLKAKSPPVPTLSLRTAFAVFLGIIGLRMARGGLHAMRRAGEA